MSYTPEVQVDSTGEWRGVAACFATEEEAIAYFVSRAPRGTSLLDIRVVESGDPVNYRWVNGKAEPVAGAFDAPPIDPWSEKGRTLALEASRTDFGSGEHQHCVSFSTRRSGSALGFASTVLSARGFRWWAATFSIKPSSTEYFLGSALCW